MGPACAQGGGGCGLYRPEPEVRLRAVAEARPIPAPGAAPLCRDAYVALSAERGGRPAPPPESPPWT